MMGGDRRRSARGRFGILVAGAFLASSSIEAAAGTRSSDIFYNCDASGTAVAKDVGGGFEWSVQNVFFGNRIFGTQRSPEGDYIGLTCETGHRTPEMIDLTCRSFDPLAGVCGEPVAAQVPASFLYGGFPNPMNSLFDVTNTYLFFLRTDEETLSFSARFMSAAFSASDQPYLVGQTMPATEFAYLARTIDFPGGTTSPQNFLVGIRTAEHCYDLEVTPTDEHVLVGTFDVSARGGKTLCAEKVSENHPVALVPIAGSGSTFCQYEVVSSGACTRGTLTAGTNVCLPCDGTCSTFANKISILFDVDGSSYGRCRDVEVKLATGASCSTSCTGTKAIGAS